MAVMQNFVPRKDFSSVAITSVSKGVLLISRSVRKWSPRTKVMWVSSGVGSFTWIIHEKTTFQHLVGKHWFLFVVVARSFESQLHLLLKICIRNSCFCRSLHSRQFRLVLRKRRHKQLQERCATRIVVEQAQLVLCECNSHWMDMLCEMHCNPFVRCTECCSHSQL